MKRFDGREYDQLRDISIVTNYQKGPEGSVLISMGDTKVICSASVENGVPPFLRDSGKGWVTAEYSMLPGSTSPRKRRDRGGKIDGRSQEIQRLIGRAFRSVVDLEKLTDYTIRVDCDVLQADGGTRTASITGGFLALMLAFEWMVENGLIDKPPITNFISAVSVGVVDGKVSLDLPYEEDSRAQVDMNVVMTDDKKFIEIQGTGEEFPFSADQLNVMIKYAEKGCLDLIDIVKTTLNL